MSTAPSAATDPRRDQVVADLDLINDGTIEQLFEKIDSAYESILEEILQYDREAI